MIERHGRVPVAIRFTRLGERETRNTLLLAVRARIGKDGRNRFLVLAGKIMRLEVRQRPGRVAIARIVLQAPPESGNAVLAVAENAQRLAPDKIDIAHPQ